MNDDEVRRIPALEVFLKNHGTIVVLRTVSAALNRDRSVLSLATYRKLVEVRGATTGEGVDLVLTPGDALAQRMVTDRHWPRAVNVEKLALPLLGTSDGDKLSVAYAKLGNTSLREYIRDRVAGQILFDWARAAAQAAVDAIEARRIYEGRVVICSEPFIGLLAHYVVLNSPVLSRCWVSSMLDMAPQHGEGFVINLTDTGRPQIKPLLAPTASLTAPLTAPKKVLTFVPTRPQNK